jgi:AraC-like DNA-binding protein
MAGLPEWWVSRSGGAPGTPSAWETPPPARLPRRLTIKGGFRVDGGHHRQLDQQARRLGFADLRACLQALLEDGWSVPQLAAHLATTQAAIRRAIADHRLSQPPRRELLARQRQRTAHRRAATRVAELGFAGVRAYLVDRLVTKAWTLAEVAAELGAARGTLRRLLDHYQVRRVAPTRRQRGAATAASGPRQQARAAQRRQARLAELGFATLEDYLRDRHVRGGWSVRRLGAELGVGHGWLEGQLRRLGLRS